jgi:hypothetical protein
LAYQRRSHTTAGVKFKPPLFRRILRALVQVIGQTPSLPNAFVFWSKHALFDLALDENKALALSCALVGRGASLILLALTSRIASRACLLSAGSKTKTASESPSCLRRNPEATARRFRARSVWSKLRSREDASSTIPRHPALCSNMWPNLPRMIESWHSSNFTRIRYFSANSNRVLWDSITHTPAHKSVYPPCTSLRRF